LHDARNNFTGKIIWDKLKKQKISDKKQRRKKRAQEEEGEDVGFKVFSR
jgi:hypothetical protein